MYNSQIQINTGISKSSFVNNISSFAMPNSMGIDKAEKSEFKDVLSGLAKNLNDDMNKPDKLLSDLVAGRNGVDVHDVITAMTKAELNISIATQAVGKVIQAYDKISQIQV